MTPTRPRSPADPSGYRRRRASTCVPPTADLESFWPSRRGHAFDQHCL